MNDPNGLVFHEGLFHLFYQHLSPKHWGHATSPDLVEWTHRSIALSPDEDGEIWSGSVVLDQRDSSGFFDGGSGLVAIFTHRTETSQSQSLAFSRDGGETWTKHEGNPVLTSDLSDFRDPKVFWDEPRSRWAMVLAEAGSLGFYASTDLRAWMPTGHLFPEPAGLIWECPDLFPMPLEGDPSATFWVLLASWHEPSVFTEGRGEAGVRYFVGAFNGEVFEASTGFPAEGLPLSEGPDEYATATWSAPNGRRIAIGWMDHWLHAHDRTRRGWPSTMTFPRELILVGGRQHPVLIQGPVQELGERLTEVYLDDSPAGGIEFQLPGSACEIGVCLTDPVLEGVEIEIAGTTLSLVQDTVCVAGAGSLPVERSREGIHLRAILDEGGIDLFLDYGRSYIALRRAPDRGEDRTFRLTLPLDQAARLSVRKYSG